MPSQLSFSDSLVPPLSQSFGTSFSQQGSISWVDLAKCLVSASIGFYQRLSGSDVGVDTATVGLVLGSRFKFGHFGRDNFLKALKQLPSMSTYGNVIWFGFGVRHLIRDLTTKEEGGVLVALCGALSCYHEDVAAEILHEMVDILNPQENPAPSILQWKSLLKVCGGVLSTTDFPVKAETLMRKHSYLQYLNSNATAVDPSSRLRGHASPEEVAKALLAVADLSRKKLESITVVGAADGGWLAAVAEWMFNLKVVIIGTDGRECYNNCGIHDTVQLTVEFTEQNGVNDNSDLVCTDQIFRLQHTMGMFRRQDGSLGMTLLSGRVEWSSALMATFGSDFQKLIEMRVAAGKAIGNAARVFEAVASSEKGVMLDTARDCTSYSEASRGRGFISSALEIFPELKGMQMDMDQGIRMSFEEAKAAYETNRSFLCRGCGCKICQDGEDGMQSEERFCSVILLETIIVMIRSIAGMTIAPQLRPARSGLEAFYERQLKVNFCTSHEQERERSRYGKISNLLEIAFSALDEAWQQVEAVAVRRLIDAVRLFSGRGIPDSSWHTSAVCVSGICVFLDVFQKLSDSSEDIARCHVMPGSIEMQEKTFDWIEDLSDHQVQGMPARKRQGIDTSPASVVSVQDLQDNFTGSTLIVCEKIRAIQAAIVLQRDSASPILISPAMLGASLVQSSGLVYCNGKKCSRAKPLTADPHIGPTGVVMSEPLSLWRFQGSEVGRCAAIISISSATPQYTTILQGQACSNCCVQAAIKSESSHILILQPGRNARVRKLM